MCSSPYSPRARARTLSTDSSARFSSSRTSSRKSFPSAVSITPRGLRRTRSTPISSSKSCTCRLTRDTGELLRLYHRLRLKGIDIVGVSDGIASGQQGGKVHLTVKGLVNELYLDDLRDKTHRGLAGCATRGLSDGGRIFGYQTVPVETTRRGTRHTAPARFEINPVEAAIVERIFRDYAAGQSMQTIAFALN